MVDYWWCVTRYDLRRLSNNLYIKSKEKCEKRKVAIPPKNRGDNGERRIWDESETVSREWYHGGVEVWLCASPLSGQNMFPIRDDSFPDILTQVAALGLISEAHVMQKNSHVFVTTHHLAPPLYCDHLAVGGISRCQHDTRGNPVNLKAETLRVASQMLCPVI